MSAANTSTRALQGRAQELLLLALLATTGFLGTRHLVLADELGAYSCCGDPQCTRLLATAACPNGDADCTGSYRCCELRCNDPRG